MWKSAIGLTVGLAVVGFTTNAYGALPEGQLYAGTSMANITPTDNAYDLANNPLTLGQDEIFARALVLDNGLTSVAIVSLDLSFFGSEYVVSQAKSRYGVDHVILSSSHVHSSMEPDGLRNAPSGFLDSQNDPARIVDWPALSSDPWYSATEEKIITAIGDAMDNRFAASIVSDSGYFQSDYMAHNRRIVVDGVYQGMMWDNPSGLTTTPIDPTVGFIRIDDDSGAPRAFLTHYAAHPVTQMYTGVLSRDYPGPMVDHLEDQLGEQCMGMFLQGASGDLDTYEVGSAGEDSPARWALVEQEGVQLADAALQVAQSTTSESQTNVSIRVREDLLTLERRYLPGTTQVTVTTVVIGDDLALVSIPGEVFIGHQLNLRDISPIENTFLLGLSYSGPGSPHLVYVPTATAAVQGGYGADSCTFIGIGAGEYMVSQAAANIEDILAGVIIADANADGVVDLQDFGILKHNFGMLSGATKAQGDFNEDGRVSLEDFVVLKANFAKGGTAIPEPATAMILLAGAAVAMRRRK